MLVSQFKPVITNVVCTANMEQTVDIGKMVSMPCCIYDNEIYGGRCGYVKLPDMQDKVTIFPSGKMISLGSKSVAKAIEQLNGAKHHLVQEGLIHDCVITPQIRNIIATLDTMQKIPIDVFSSKISGAVYDPETFAVMILKGLAICSFLVFASGKIVIAGARSEKELNTTAFDLLTKLSQFKE